MGKKLRKVIQFRSMMDDLSKQEFLQLMNKIYDLNQMHLIKASMFLYFMQSSTPNADTHDLDRINSTISQIIQSREDSKEPSTTPKIKVDNLPSALIGNIASYFDQREYIRFQKSNRPIYIGCNSPNKLSYLYFFVDRDLSSFNISDFPSIKRLMLPLNACHKLRLESNTRYIINDLETLTLYAGNKGDFDIEPFMKQNSINTANINTLEFIGFGLCGVAFPINKVWTLLTKFPNIECLSIATNRFSSAIDQNKLKTLYPNLHGLYINGSVFSRTILMEFAPNLRYLTCDLEGGFLNGGDLNGVSFGEWRELREVKFKYTTLGIMNDILKTSHHLNKLRVLFSPFNGNVNVLSESISKVFKTSKELECIEIGVSQQSECIAILNGIESGLFATKTVHRKQLKIMVYYVYPEDIDANGLMVNVATIIRWLERPNIKQFMFIWNLSEIEQETNKEEILNELKEISVGVEVMVSDDFCVVMTNKNCTINGWNTRWTLSV